MRCGVYVRVSTDDQKDNGYSIDSQLRMIKEYCEKKNYDIIDVYNDAGHSGKDLMRPEMQRLLKDIKSKKIDKLVAVKVDRLTRSNYDGFWLLNYLEEHDVKLELILEPFDVSTANGEMIYGMNLVFGQRERKEIGARTKRAMEEMAMEHIHPSKAPYGYTRNKETGHLEIEPIEAEVVKEIFELCKERHSTRNITTIMKDNNAYLKQGKWKVDRVYKILTNSIYIGIFEYGKYKRKPEDILKVENYCEPIIDLKTWNITRKNLEKNKHPNYGEHIHLFTSLIKCPECGNILSSTISYKYSGKPNKKEYYHLTCKNVNCKAKGLHYSSDKIEKKLGRVLNELTRYMYDMNNEIIVSNESEFNNRLEYGKEVLKGLFDELTKYLGKGYSVSNLKYMRMFYKVYPNFDVISSNLSWSHYLELMIIEDKDKRNFYEKECINSNWSVRELRRQLDTSLFKRLLLSDGETNKEKVYKLSTKGQELNKPSDIIKQPYVFEFLDVKENKPVLEKDLEYKLIRHIEDFLLELGKGFMFVGSQQRITLNNTDYYVDMVFYNKFLKSYVLIDLKMNKLKA